MPTTPNPALRSDPPAEARRVVQMIRTAEDMRPYERDGVRLDGVHGYAWWVNGWWIALEGDSPVTSERLLKDNGGSVFVSYDPAAAGADSPDERVAITTAIETAVWAWFNENDAPWSPADRVVRSFASNLAAVVLETAMQRHGPCVCDTSPATDGPDEYCPRHGRTYADVLERGAAAAAEHEAARDTLTRLRAALADADGVAEALGDDCGHAFRDAVRHLLTSPADAAATTAGVVS